MEERTHPATERQRRRFRQRGEVARSRDLTGLAAIAGTVAGLALFAGFSSAALLRLAASVFAGLAEPNPAGLATLAGATLAKATAPALLVGCVAVVAVGLLQTRGNVAGDSLSFDLTRLNPLPRLKQTYASTGAIVSLALSVAKVSLVGTIAALTLTDRLPPLLVGPPNDLGAALLAGGDVLLTLLLRVGGGMLAMSVADYAVNWLKLEKRMRMTTRELRDDLKEVEGDPHTRQRRKRRARELVMQRSLREVPKSDVVVVNPTHYAVALSYDAARMGAPRVVAKGADALASRIRSIARAAGVPILQQPPLARTLFMHVGAGKEVPIDLYHAVAALLAHVQRIRRRG